MAFKDFREWLDRLEAEGELKRIEAKVDWDGEIAGIVQETFRQRGPALLFENIKGHENTWGKKLFCGGLAGRRRIALLLGLPKDASREEITQATRERFKNPVKPVSVGTGPVKENIVKGKDIDLFQFPVPKWHPLDGGRYINTFCAVVTRDPDTSELNAGLYRGMISGRDKIGVLLVPAQHWGLHFDKYQEKAKPMPVAIVYGWDESLVCAAASPDPHPGASEYDVAGGLRQQPVELVKCETSDLEVPASAEIVVEGMVSTDPATFEMEGPFGEWRGFYGEARLRPVIKVNCITFRNDPILRGSLTGLTAEVIGEADTMSAFTHTALVWNILESQGVPGVLDVIPAPWTVVKIHKTERGQARRIAAALWGSQMALNFLKIVVVVEEDVDIRNFREVQWAILNYVDPEKDLVVFPGTGGATLDPSQSAEDSDELKYGAGKMNRLLIDATIDWETHPKRKEWGNKRFPPKCTAALPEIQELVEKRWSEYGF